MSYKVISYRFVVDKFDYFTSCSKTGETLGYGTTSRDESFSKNYITIMWRPAVKIPGAGKLISNDKKNLTLKNMCKGCTTSNSLMNVQCMAKNVHGSIIADGYLNVLSKSLSNCLSCTDGNTDYHCSEGFDKKILLAYGR